MASCKVGYIDTILSKTRLSTVYLTQLKLPKGANTVLLPMNQQADKQHARLHSVRPINVFNCLVLILFAFCIWFKLFVALFLDLSYTHGSIRTINEMNDHFLTIPLTYFQTVDRTCCDYPMLITRDGSNLFM